MARKRINAALDACPIKRDDKEEEIESHRHRMYEAAKRILCCDKTPSIVAHLKSDNDQEGGHG